MAENDFQVPDLWRCADYKPSRSQRLHNEPQRQITSGRPVSTRRARWPIVEPMGRKRCPEDSGSYRIDKVACHARVICSCGWASKYHDTEDEAVEAWGFHRGRRAGDALRVGREACYS